MAIYTASDSNYLWRSNPWGGSITSLTVCAWVRWGSTTNYRCPFSVDDGSDNFFYVEPESSNIRGYLTTSTQITITSLSASTWYFVCIVMDGTNQDFFGYGAAVTASSLSSASDTSTGVSSFPSTSDIVIGRNLAFTGEYLSGRVCHVKVWDAVLSSTEVEQERWSRRPQRWSNLKAWYPLDGTTVASSLRDLSGNGLTLTQVGSPTVEDGPPVPGGAFPLPVGPTAGGLFLPGYYL